MHRYIATFGSAHLGGFGLFYHLEIVARSEHAARAVLCDSDGFNRRWAGIYDAEQYLAGNNGFDYQATQPLGKLLVTDEYRWRAVRPEGWTR